MELEAVPYYRLPRDEDGRRSFHWDRLFELALRWQPGVPIPEGMVSASSRKTDTPVHMGVAALTTLGGGGEISQRQLDAALSWLYAALSFYEGAIYEPYPGRNTEALGNLRELLDELTGTVQ
jgi:hypothetical protein